MQYRKKVSDEYIARIKAGNITNPRQIKCKNLIGLIHNIGKSYPKNMVSFSSTTRNWHTFTSSHLIIRNCNWIYNLYESNNAQLKTNKKSNMGHLWILILTGIGMEGKRQGPLTRYNGGIENINMYRTQNGWERQSESFASQSLLAGTASTDWLTSSGAGTFASHTCRCRSDHDSRYRHLWIDSWVRIFTCRLVADIYVIIKFFQNT
jgi:hypothetical protein